MKNIRLTLLAAAAMGAVSFGGATAMPFNDLSAALGESLVQDVRVVCNRYGRCYETNRNYRQTRRYAPRYYDGGYYNEPRYGYYGSPGVGVGIGPFGFRTW